MKDLESALRETARLAGWFAREESERPEMRYLPPEALRERLDLSIGERGIGSDAEFFELLRSVMEWTPKTASRRFVNQLFGGRSVPAVCAETLAAVLNVSMYTYKVAGPHVLIEKEVVRKMMQKAGFDRGEGVLLPGGSISNLGAMLLARDRTGRVRDEGVPPGLTAYTSESAHYSMLKNAGFVGIGRSALRRVPVDGQGRMLPDRLAEMIAADRREGLRPFFVCATAGTTVEGAFDPFEAIAQITTREQVWLHIDGALGSTALLSPRHRHLLAGCEQADSLAWNAHKLMGVPLSCSALLVRHEGLLQKSFAQEADYLFQTEADEYNLGKISPQCGKRNDAFKIWAAWKYHGDEGYAARTERLFELAQYATRRVETHPEMTLACPTASVCVCFNVEGAGAKEICKRLDATGRLKVGYGTIAGRSAIRLPCVNPEFDERAIDGFFEVVLEMARKLRAAPR